MEKILISSLQDNERHHINTLKYKRQLPEVLYDKGGPLFEGENEESQLMYQGRDFVKDTFLEKYKNKAQGIVQSALELAPGTGQFMNAGNIAKNIYEGIPIKLSEVMDIIGAVTKNPYLQIPDAILDTYDAGQTVFDYPDMPEQVRDFIENPIPLPTTNSGKNVSKKWLDLSMREKAAAIRNAVKIHHANGGSLTDISIDDIRHLFDEGGYSAGNLVNAIYERPNIVEELPAQEPIENYNNVNLELLKLLLSDEREHYDDSVKLLNHPTHPSRGTFEGLFRYNLTDRGMEDPNYSMFGMVDGGLDPLATLLYKDRIVLPEITVTPQGNYFHDTYNNIKIHDNGGLLIHLYDGKSEDSLLMSLADGEVDYSYLSHPLNAFRYNGSPSYTSDIPFATAFADAVRNNADNFLWNDLMYNTDINWEKRFEKDEKGNKPFKEFAETMYPAVILVLLENGYPISLAHNIVRQAGLESDYGLDPRGERGFNLSGIKWTKAANPKYKHTTGADGEEYIDFDNLHDYLNYKVKLLNNNYDALNATSVNDFVNRLHPKASGRKERAAGYLGDYSGDYNSYKTNLPGTKSLDKYLMSMYWQLFPKK